MKTRTTLWQREGLGRALACGLAALLTCGLVSSRALAAGGHISFLIGNFSYSTPAGSASGLANYSLSYSYDASRKLAIYAGANAILSKIISGQGGFGFDIGVSYYPFTTAGPIHEKSDNIEVVTWQVWRPYVGFGLRQRTFVAASQASYIGTGISFGVDRQLNERFSLRLQANYDKLTGPGSISATQTNAAVGGSIHY